jgi:hypothetical protein
MWWVKDQGLGSKKRAEGNDIGKKEGWIRNEVGCPKGQRWNHGWFQSHNKGTWDRQVWALKSIREGNIRNQRSQGTKLKTKGWALGSYHQVA